MKNRVGISVLASGSKGNSIFIDGPEGALILDAGLSAREIIRRLVAAGADPGRVRGILVTHEHSDHIRGVRVLARRLGATVYGTMHTLEASGLPDHAPRKAIDPGNRFSAAGFSIRPFSLPHDAADPVGYVFRNSGLKVGVATDLGCSTALVQRRLAGCDMLVLESNYDEKMLRDGPYPWFLKQRIRSRRGHLSNDVSSGVLEGLVHGGLQRVVLAHLSEVNNSPDAALAAALSATGYGNGVELTAAGQSEPTPIMVLET